MRYRFSSKLRLNPGFSGQPYLRILWFDKDGMCCGKNVIHAPDFKAKPPTTVQEYKFDGTITAAKHAVRGVIENFCKWNCVQANKIGSFDITVPANMVEETGPIDESLVANWNKEYVVTGTRGGSMADAKAPA